MPTITMDEIGAHMYLFRDHARVANTLVICAHGGYTPASGQVAVPTHTSLHFFGPHGRFISHPLLEDILQDKVHAYEQVDAGTNVFDYTLTKYQGTHAASSAPQTYEDIAADLSVNQDPRRPMDVLTIRNRGGFRARRIITLSTVLSALAAARLNYTSIYCSFCRGNTGDPVYTPYGA